MKMSTWQKNGVTITILYKGHEISRKKLKKVLKKELKNLKTFA